LGVRSNIEPLWPLDIKAASLNVKSLGTTMREWSPS